MTVEVCVTAAAPARLAAAARWLAQRPGDEPLLILAPSVAAANEIVYRVLAGAGGPAEAASGGVGGSGTGEGARTGAAGAGATPGHAGAGAGAFGWHRLTLPQLASQLALPELMARHNRVPVGPLGTQAAIARAIRQVRDAGGLGRYAAVADTPGFALAADRSITELRLAGVDGARLAPHDPALAAIADAMAAVLDGAGLTDRAAVLEAARGIIEGGRARAPFDGCPVLVLDPVLDHPLECRLLRALLGRASSALVTLPHALAGGEDPASGETFAALATRVVAADASVHDTDESRASAARHLLRRLQSELFSELKAAEAADVPAQPGEGEGTAAAAAGSDPVSAAPADGPRDPTGRGGTGGDGGGGADGAVAPAHEPFTLDLFSTPAGAVAEAPAASLRVFSAPGESRECVEIARALRDHAAAGVPFDDMAVLLRAPEQYRPHLEEAFERAGIPAWFARGAVRPDPAGRAFLALLHCRDEGLSAHRFAEYLSLGEVPAPPAPAADAAPDADWIAPDPELVPIRGIREEEQADALREATGAPVPGAAGPPAGARDGIEDGGLRAPWRWEQLLHDAAVIGGADRWRRRLDGLEAELALKREELLAAGEDTRQAAVERQREDLRHLRAFALPLVGALGELPASATWGEWLNLLAPLATRTLRDPRRVQAVLSELRPMASVGPVTLADVINVLAPRLRDLAEPPPRSRFGRVFVAPVASARAMSFEVVFVPGLAEKLFPQKIVEDPVLLDEVRRRLDGALVTNRDRVDRERDLLRLAVGAARREVVLSYPRMDMEQGRPRVASFYTLEAIRAAEGELLDFEALATRAELQTRARIGWPAPDDTAAAIDEAEHDLSLLQRLLNADEAEATGAARYLLQVNPHLSRALRFRARRWLRRWTPADGLVGPLGEAAAAALASHGFDQRTYSPTALQNYATCPYRFLLYAIHKLSVREVPAAIDQMDALQRGSLIHDVQYRLLTALRDANALPVRPATLDAAQARLDEVLAEVAATYRDDLAPAIDRVWEDGIATIRTDLRGWLRRMAEDDSGFVPWAFELSFGLESARDRDERSVADGVLLASGIRLRGSIDLVERRADGDMRVTDYKTGRNRTEKHLVVGGGEHLQPVLYAQAAERLYGDRSHVVSGRLWYCTVRGEYGEHEVPYDDRARQAAATVAQTIATALRQQFLPAAPKPSKGFATTCEYCDYLTVCGPYEAERVKRKPRQELIPLDTLRDLS